MLETKKTFCRFCHVFCGLEVDLEDIIEAAKIFSNADSAAAMSGTGLHMARHQNLTTQLVQTLNALCGRVGSAERVRGHCNS